MLSDLAGLMQQVVADSEAKYASILGSLRHALSSPPDRRGMSSSKTRTGPEVPLDLKVGYCDSMLSTAMPHVHF